MTVKDGAGVPRPRVELKPDMSPEEQTRAMVFGIERTLSAAKRGSNDLVPLTTVKKRTVNIRLLPDACRIFPEKVQEGVAAFMEKAKNARYFEPDGKPRPEWRVVYGETWEAARLAARALVKEAQPDVLITERGELIDQGRDECYAGWKASENTARSYAVLEAWSATSGMVTKAILARACEPDGASVRTNGLELAMQHEINAPSDASQVAALLSVDDLNYAEKEGHMKHAMARWEVWQKGYGLLGEFGGVLYVYCKGEAPKGI